MLSCSPISCKKCFCFNVSLQLDDLHIHDVVMGDAGYQGYPYPGQCSDMELDVATSYDEDDDILPVNMGDNKFCDETAAVKY